VLLPSGRVNEEKPVISRSTSLTGPVRPLGKLGSRQGPHIFWGRQFCKINIEKINFGKFINETTLPYFKIRILK